MKIDKEMLKSLATKPDGELWGVISGLAKSRGYELPEATPSKEEMAKIRSLLNDVEKINMREAIRFVNNYRKKG